MIYTVIVDFRRIEYLFKENGPVATDGVQKVFAHFPKEIIEKIESTGSSVLAYQRTGAYIALYNTLRHFLEKDEIILSKRECGKPCLLNKTRDAEINAKISLSHCDTLAAVTISDEGEVGVDIEEKIKKAREDRLKKRFFVGDCGASEEICPIYLLATLTESLTSIFAEIPSEKLPVAQTEEFSRKWTLCEAAMKCDGRGFEAMGEIENILLNSCADSRSFKYRGKEYFISTVKEKT